MRLYIGDNLSSTLTATYLFSRRFLLVLILFLGINLFVISYLAQEKYIHFWDTSNYWIMYQDFGNLLKHDAFQAIRNLITSIRHDDYNPLPILPLMPFRFLLGDARLPYILAIVNLYAFPTILLFFFLFRTAFSSTSGKQSILPYVFPLTLALLPQFWVPVLRGFPDVIGVLIITVVMLFYFSRPIEEQIFIHLFLVSFLLVLMILMRRWYAFWVVSFFMALLFDGFVFNFPVYRFEIKKYRPALRNILLVGMISAFLLFLIAAPVAERMVLTDYTDIYSAYRNYDSLIVPIKRIYDYFGFVPILLFSCGLFFSILDRRTRRYSLFLFLQLIFIVLLFSRTQNFGSQHYYLLIPTIVVFMTLIARRILHARPMLYQILFLAGFVFLYSINFSYTLIPKAYAHFERFASPLLGVRHFPLVRRDIGVLNDLLISLNHLISSKNDLVYVLSSSVILNDDLLRKASRMNHMTIQKHILPVCHVDKRDGFPYNFFEAKYVIVGEPIQYHLNPNDQRVIGILGGQILHQKKIGSSFKRLPYEFNLDNNVRVSIYEKKSPVRGSDIEDLSKLFISDYPDKKATFKIDLLPCEMYDERPKDLMGSLEVNYGDKVRFLKMAFTKLPENRLEISYYWQIIGELGPYISFVHFTDLNNRILFQNDHAIGSKRSYNELIGKFIKETYFLDIPHSAANKEVYVKVGIYSPVHGDRLQIISSREIPTDDSGTRATIGKINF